MGNFFEDLAHSVLESTLTAEEQNALKVRSHRASAYSLTYQHVVTGEVSQT